LGRQQLVGYAGTKRMDTLVAAVTASMMFEEIVDFDWVYSSPSAVWDPIQQAAGEALKNITREKGK